MENICTKSYNGEYKLFTIIDEYFMKIETAITFILQFQLDSKSMIDIKKLISQVGRLIQNS
jgi:hypothetical protein